MVGANYIFIFQEGWQQSVTLKSCVERACLVLVRYCQHNGRFPNCQRNQETQQQLQHVGNIHDLFKVVDGSETTPPQEDPNGALRKWRIKPGKAMFSLKTTIEGTCQSIFRMRTSYYQFHNVTWRLLSISTKSSRSTERLLN